MYKSNDVIQWRCSPDVLCICDVLCFWFFFGRSLSCQRITLHKNLFFSFILNSIITIIWLTAVASNQELVLRNPVSMASDTVQFVLICDWNQFKLTLFYGKIQTYNWIWSELWWTNLICIYLIWSNWCH